MLTRTDWIDLVPHRGRMALIDRVLGYDGERIHAQSDNHRAADHPLRRGGRLGAVHLCEYGAQAMAVHGALVARAAGGLAHPGLLVALRAVDVRAARLDDLPGPLDIHAERIQADAAAWLYRFEVRHGGAMLAGGQAMVKLDPREPART